MSSKKEKFLESAQKFILKGQLDRAIKDYEQVVAMDPDDVRQRQRLAELLVRVNRKEGAIGEYESIGKHYADNGYYLKAIAVYKQIHKLDPDNIKTSLSLASLNEKQGLTGNALAEYSRVYSFYDRSGKRADANSILEKMIAIDPENLNTRLKFAEARFAGGNADPAYEDFVQIALLLRKREDENALKQVCDRVDYLYAGKREFLLDLAASQLRSGDAASAIPGLREIANKDQHNLRAWQLLADALRTAGERQELKKVLQHMVSQFPGELYPREGLIGCALDEEDAGNALLLLELHGPLFLEKGAYEFLERVYLGLLERMPEDSRLLQGLKSLYEASGEEAKLAGIASRLGPPTQDKGERELRVDELLSRDAGAFFAEGPAEPLRNSALEEETDAGLPEDGPDVPAASVTGVDAEKLERPAFYGGMSPDGLEEAHVELELSEDELVDLEELYGQGGADDIISGNAPAERTDTAAAEDFPCGDASVSGGNEYVELEAELFAELEAEEAAPPAVYDKYSLDGLFSAFKKELGQQLDKEDTETHYNLGIAYKEMGLYDDAIAEFRAAALDFRRKVDCIILQGICCRDKGDLAGAEKIFRMGISLAGMTAGELSPLKYELALLFDTAGRKEDALLLYREIHAVNPGFRDAAEKIAELCGGEAQEYYDLDLIEPDGEVE